MFMESNLPVTMPALALRGLTVFPNMLLHFDVGREASIKALDEAMDHRGSRFSWSLSVTSLWRARS